MKAILTYHSVDPSGSPISISECVFREHVDWLARSEVEAVDLGTLLELPPDADAVAVTFDDGFASFGRLAWPLLRRRGIPATVFVVTDQVGDRNRWDGSHGSIPEFRLLDWEELGRLAEEGVELGSHTRTHADLTAAGSSRVRDEVVGSADRMEQQLGRRPRTFAYPYGRYDASVCAIVRKHYQLACTSELRTADDSEPPHLLPRIDAYYLRRQGQITRWGSRRLRIRLGIRRLGRRVRETFELGEAS